MPSPSRRQQLVASAVLLLALPLALACAAGPDAEAQDANPRFGVWKLRSDNPPPYENIMTYAPWEDGGMSITVATTNADGETSEWSYETLFDGVFRPVAGLENSDTAVEIVTDNSTRILNRRDGHVYQVIINTLNEDASRIDNDYVRLDEEGRITRVTRATYDRIED